MAPGSPPSSRFGSALDRIRSRIEAYGREVTVVAVTKGQPWAATEAAFAAGLPLAENRIQEALPKMAALPAAEWHLIGHLQSNKVAKAAGRFALIQSVDSELTAERIARLSPAQAVLVQVNISGEAMKQGCAPNEAVDVCRRVGELLDLRGLMGIGPLGRDPAPAFRLLAGLRNDAEQAVGRGLPVLSMGMSEDWEVALECGSSMLRLGRVLFGERNLRKDKC
jgi:pyridoxal phosphate enzyme (YggS family)